MGKLLEALQRPGGTTGSGIGFGRPQNASKPKAAAIVVSVDRADTIATLVKAGADVVIVPESAAAEAKASGATWGIDARLDEKLTGAKLRELHEQGAQFVVLTASAPARVLGETIEQFDRALVITPPENDPLYTLLRAYNFADVEVGVLDLQLGARDLTSLTIDTATRLRALSEILRFPIIATVREAPATEDVRVLVKLGAQGIWLANPAAETVTTLREELERIPREKDASSTLGLMQERR